MTPRQRALHAVTPRGRIGVELGPLNKPLILREDGEVLYADHRSTEDLRRKYAEHDTVVGAQASTIVDVDLVLENQTLPEALGSRAPVDYVVASHVLEHIADPVGWLAEIAGILRDGGVLFLVVPDKRFTFDFYRTPSTAGDLVASHLTRATIGSPAQVFEHVARAAAVDVPAVWSGRGRTPEPMFDSQLGSALVHARGVADSGFYFDVHCTVYTPVSFLAVFRDLIALGLIPFEIAEIVPTPRYALEFYVTLRKRESLDPAARAAATPQLDPVHHELPEAPVRGMGPRLAAALRLGYRMLRSGSIREPGAGRHG